MNIWDITDSSTIAQASIATITKVTVPWSPDSSATQVYLPGPMLRMAGDGGGFI
ncbi:hypothetical protein ES702_00405 [subsurface metagenome]